MVLIMRPILTLLILSLATVLQANEPILQGESEGVVGRLMAFNAGVEITYDENNLPSHSIEWDSDDELMEYSIQPTPDTLIIPTGLKAKTFRLKVRVIDWEMRRIDVGYKTVIIRGPPVIDPPPVVDPPPTNDFQRLAAAEFRKIIAGSVDKEKAKKVALVMAESYEVSITYVGFTAAKSLEEAIIFIQDNQMKAMERLDDVFDDWGPAFIRIGELVDENPPKTIAEYKLIVQSLARALRVEAA